MAEATKAAVSQISAGEQVAGPGDIRPPRQRRSQESFERVLVAGADLLREVGNAGFSMQTVSERAGVGIGSIYLRAPSRDALILAIHAREMQRIETEETAVIEAVMSADLPSPAHVTALITGIGQLMLRNADILSVFMSIGPADTMVWNQGAEQSQKVGARFRAALDRVRAEVTHPDPELAIDMVFRILYDTIARRISRGEQFESDRSLSRESLLSELSRMSVLYLFGS
ncbi:TetR/AcrR family transcriptional regulator [Microbacterium sp. NPDC058062]|uniref:TetR/AcrR family transcriptional regulator n=1 Tax=Microbacterium sp. NPDC058062 TaxID=3346320 RepID=UPI0036DF0171